MHSFIGEDDNCRRDNICFEAKWNICQKNEKFCNFSGMSCVYRCTTFKCFIRKGLLAYSVYLHFYIIYYGDQMFRKRIVMMTLEDDAT